MLLILFSLLSESHTHTLSFLGPENVQMSGQRDVCQHLVEEGERGKLHAKQPQPLLGQLTASKKMRKRGRGSDTWH